MFPRDLFEFHVFKEDLSVIDFHGFRFTAAFAELESTQRRRYHALFVVARVFFT